MITTTNTISDNPHHSAVCDPYHRVLDAAAELSEKVDGTAESHDTHFEAVVDGLVGQADFEKLLLHSGDVR